MVAGCAPVVTLTPDIALTGVTRPATAEQRYGPQAISLLAIKFLALGDGVYSDLENRSSFPVQIDWTLAAFVDPKGKSQAIMRAGMKYDNCIAPKESQIIVAHETERSLHPETISVVLPIKTRDVVYDCTFTFELRDVDIHKNPGEVQRS